MRIKKFRNNEYVLAEGVWVRNPFKTTKPLDLNSLHKKESLDLLGNEIENMKTSSVQMDSLNKIEVDNLVICSDGYGWKDRQYVLSKLSSKIVKVIGVNGSLSKWEMAGEEAKAKRTMTFYLANNPYRDCMAYLPRTHKYYPNLVASSKTFPNFLRSYRSEPYLYKATNDLDYSGAKSDISLFLDDYRNPICAALSLGVFLGAKKIMLLCCDESFEDERPNAVRMKNGLYQYPQQIMCQKIIDKQFYWLKKNGVKIADCSSGIEYENAEYIDLEGVESFFSENQT
jgi:hypothetical protein